PEKVINLSDSCDGAFATSVAGALLDADGGRDAGDQIHVGAGKLFDELPGIEAHRIQKAPLALGEQEVKRQRALAGAADTGDNDKPVAGDRQRQVFQVVLPRAVDRDDFAELGGCIAAVEHRTTVAQEGTAFKVFARN